MEHTRLIELISSSNKIFKVVVADVMAGVGPFAIPLAMNNNIKAVYANGNLFYRI
jgi:tRNA G37 N-methylase Trm5